MSHLLSFTPKSPEGDLHHLPAFVMLTAEAPLGVWGEIIRQQIVSITYERNTSSYL
jgi:hypothetical protein